MDGSSQIAFLERWYAEQCDGDWEHQYGVRIETLDNPGWHIHIDLVGTILEGSILPRQVFENEDSWIQWWSDGRRFEAAAGPLDFDAALEKFHLFVQAVPQPQE